MICHCNKRSHASEQHRKRDEPNEICPPIAARLSHQQLLEANVYPKDTRIVIQSGDPTGSADSTLRLIGTSDIVLSGSFLLSNVTVEPGAVVAVEGMLVVGGNVSLVASTHEYSPPSFHLMPGSTLRVDVGGRLVLDGFGTFSASSTSTVHVVGDDARGVDAPLRIIRRAVRSATFVELAGSFVWARPAGAESLLAATVRQIGQGSISEVTLSGSYSTTTNDTLVPGPINGTGDSVDIVLRVDKHLDVLMSTSAAQGLADDDDDEGDEQSNTVPLVVVVLVVSTCLALIAFGAIRRRRVTARQQAQQQTFEVAGRNVEYYEPEMMQSNLVGVRVMGHDETAHRSTRASRSSSRYFKPPSGDGGGYVAPQTKKHVNDGTVKGGAGVRSAVSQSPRRSRQSSLSRSSRVQSSLPLYGSVPGQAPASAWAKQEGAATDNTRRPDLYRVPPSTSPRRGEETKADAQLGTSRPSRQPTVSSAPQPAPAVQSYIPQTSAADGAGRHQPASPRGPPAKPFTPVHPLGRPPASSPVYTALPTTSADGPRMPLAQTLLQRSGPSATAEAGTRTRPALRSRSSSSSNVVARRSQSRDSKRASRVAQSPWMMFT